MAQFERLIKSSEQEAASKLKSYIADVQDSPQQVIEMLSHIRSCCVSGWVSMVCFVF